MPCCMENLLVEVQTVNAYFILLPLAPRTHLARLQDGTRFAALPGRFQSDIPPRVSVEHSKEIVVRSSHDSAAGKQKEANLTRFPQTASSPIIPLWPTGVPTQISLELLARLFPAPPALRSSLRFGSSHCEQRAFVLPLLLHPSALPLLLHPSALPLLLHPSALPPLLHPSALPPLLHPFIPQARTGNCKSMNAPSLVLCTRWPGAQQCINYKKYLESPKEAPWVNV